MRELNPSEPRSQPPASPLRTTALILYVTLVLLALTIPQSLTNWLSDMNGSPVQETALRGAEILRNLSQRSGVAGVYQRARDLFIAVSGVEPN